MKLGTEFYARPTVEVARDLVGKMLYRRTGRATLGGRIVETEAYVGSEDKACHASKGRTRRTEVMFGPPGRAYVYLIYGMHCCLNVVTESEGYPAAVLIRALEPVCGVGQMERNRGRRVSTTDIASGPGKLCQALAVDRSLNGALLTGSVLWLEDPGDFTNARVSASGRIGIDYAGAWREKPWRFFAEDNPHVSRLRVL